ncbi:Protein TAPT1 [Clonorchis sinensis]|uniref:Protein TAPT1 n=1 Tax=Clonorchis sinensis TaxID=79923 RepID=A0A419QFV7_CLOSI|nr:Protein TAPT1 [Clonorchis sinensis]
MPFSDFLMEADTQDGTKPTDSDWDIRNPFRKFDFSSYLKEELVQSVRQRQEKSGTDNCGPFTNRVYTFVTVPQYFESFMSYGLLQCLDHLLVIYTFLPIRCFLTGVRLLSHLVSSLFQCLCQVFYGYIPIRLKRMHTPNRLFSYELRDVVRLSIIIICTTLLVNVDSSVAYHEIRTQSVIKIYLFFNLLEVADRLLSAVCLDALDDLLYTVSKPRQRPTKNGDGTDASEDNAGYNMGWLRDLVFQYCFALVCIFAHCFLLLCQVTTLNVAFNSQNKSLVTVFISNNFVELKSNVFRKMGKTNLFQIACADVRERFHYGVWLFIIVCRNMNDTGWNLDDLWSMLFDVACIFLAEVAVDWIKHSFITKFNVIPSDVYKEYTVSIAYDLLLCRQGKNTADYFDLLSRRMGLTPIPLSCLINVMLIQTVRNPGFLWLSLPVVFCMLCAVKVVANITLLSFAYAHVKAYIKAVSAAHSGVVQDTSVTSTTKDDISFSNNLKEQLFSDKQGGEPVANGMMSQRGPRDQLVPVRYTGYDQPTGEDENFLPMLLRHRRVRSESGRCPTPEPPSPPSGRGDIMVGFAAPWQSPYGEVVSENGTEVEQAKFASALTGAGDSMGTSQVLAREVFPGLGGLVPNIGLASSCSSPILPAKNSPAAVSTQDVKSSAKYSNRANALANNALTNLLTPLFGGIADKEQVNFAPPAFNFPATLDDTNMELMTSGTPNFYRNLPDELLCNPTDGSQPNLLGEKQRSYSIDLGVLSGFTRLRDTQPHDSPQIDVAVVVDTRNVTTPLPSERGVTVEKGSQTEPIRKPRMRTWTESSDTRVHKLSRDNRLPVMWEQSSRNSVVVQQLSSGRVCVKQPLSDVDRYSMVEGHIS